MSLKFLSYSLTSGVTTYLQSYVPPLDIIIFRRYRHAGFVIGLRLAVRDVWYDGNARRGMRLYPRASTDFGRVCGCRT